MKTLRLSQKEIDLLIDVVEMSENKLEDQINTTAQSFKSIKNASDKLVDALQTLKSVRQRMLFC